jgi:hypothetical protein
MKWILAFAVVSLMSLQSFAAREVRNGGGGLRVNGSYLTYYSAEGESVRQAVEPSQNIPGLDALLQEVISMPISNTAKANIINLIDNTEQHKYFRLRGELDPELRKKITDTYSKLFNIPPEQVVIFAVTNESDQATVLMPEFYSLRPTEQSAILMHESLWLSGSFSTYEEVVNGEQVTQAYLEDKSSPDKYYNFVSLLDKMWNDRYLKMKASLLFDLKYSRFPKDVIKTQKILATEFLSPEFVKGMVCTGSGEKSAYTQLTRDLYFNMRFSYEKKAKSLFYTAIADYIQQPNEYISIYWDDSILCGKGRSPDVIAKDIYIDLSTPSTEDTFTFNLVNGAGKRIGFMFF